MTYKRIPLAFIFGFSFILKYASGAYVQVGNLPSTVHVHEDAPGSTFLYSVVAYPPTATCAFNSTSPDLAIVTGISQHTVNTAASPSFDFGSMSVHEVIVECSDSGVTASGTLTVSLTENSAPVYTNLPGIVTISAKTAKANHVIYTVSYTDSDTSPPLTYSNLNTTGPFSISGDQLKLTADLLTHTVNFYEVTFDVTDGRTLTSQQIDVTINDVNSAPTFVGSTDVTQVLPEFTSGRLLLYDIDHNVNSAPTFVGSTDVTQVLPEFTSGRLLVYDIDHSDANGDFVQFVYQTVDPTNNIFDLIGATGEIYLISGNTLDFETTTMYTFLVTVSDYLVTQPTIFTLTLSVSDVNEVPSYTASPAAVTVNESAAGTVVGTLSALCVDPDGDTITYSILFSTYSAYFNVNAMTAEVTLANVWDYDSTSLPNAVNITVRCSDPDGLSDDATYSITFLDVNDNNPVCAPSSTTHFLAYSQTVNETILNLKCSDDDSTTNAQLNYTTIGHSQGYSVAYFDVDALGNVSIKIALNMKFNTTFYVTVLVTDNGNPSRSSTVTLTVSYTEKPTIITYTNEQPCFFCTSGAITLTSALGLFVLMLLILAIVLIVLRACYYRERKKIIETLSKKSKKPGWRMFGCCRPEEDGTKKKDKKSSKNPEIEKAEKTDREYMRARNALLGAEDPQRGVDSTWRKGPTSLSSSERAGVHTKRRHPGSSAGTRGAPTNGSLASTDITFRGRDKTPTGPGPTVAGVTSLTEQQKQGIEKLKLMKKTDQSVAGPSGLNTERKQAGSDTVWTFKGRDK